MASNTSLTRDELLVLAAEEGAEVTQAATKCIRFGFFREGPNGYGINCEVLAREVGDLLGVVDVLGLNWDIIADARQTKIARAERAKALYHRDV